MSVERLVSTAIGSVVPDGNDLNLYRFDGRSLDLNALADALESCPMFADYRCIVVHDLNCETVTADTLKLLLSLLDEAPDTSIVVFYATGFDVKNGKKYPTAKNRKLIDYVAKHGVVFEAVQKSLAQTVKEAQATCKEHHCTISYEDAQTVVNRCLGNSLTVRNELQKLIDCANGSSITRQMVEDLVPSYYDVDAFAFARAVVAMDGRLALKLLDELCALRAEPMAVLSAVSMAFVDLYRVKAAQSTGRGEAEVLADFNYKGREFVVRNYFRDAYRVKLEHVRKCIDVLRQTNVALVSSQVDGRVLLEQAVAKMVDAGYDSAR